MTAPVSDPPESFYTPAILMALASLGLVLIAVFWP